MTFTPIDRGTTEWDVPVNAAFVDQDTRITANTGSIAAAESGRGFRPADLGYIAWSFDPGATIAGQSGLTSGTVHMFRLEIRQQLTISTISIGIQTAGASLTVGQNFAGIYDSTGALLRSTADQSTAWTSVGLIAMPLTTPLLVNPGSYHVALLTNGGTPPSLSRGAGATNVGPILNAGTSVANARWGNDGVGQTTLPVSVNMATRTYGPTAWWGAIS